MAVPGLQGDFCGRAVFKGGKKTKMEKRERRRVDWWNALVGSFVCESVFFFFCLGRSRVKMYGNFGKGIGFGEQQAWLR